MRGLGRTEQPCHVQAAFHVRRLILCLENGIKPFLLYHAGYFPAVFATFVFNDFVGLKVHRISFGSKECKLQFACLVCKLKFALRMVFKKAERLSALLHRQSVGVLNGGFHGRIALIGLGGHCLYNPIFPLLLNRI